MSQENVDFVECKVCGFKGQTLNRHLAKHGITAEEYHQKFPGVRIACESVMKQQGESVSQTWQLKPKVEKPKVEYICPHCGGKFNHSCNLQLHLKREAEFFIHGVAGKDFVVCRECGMRSENLSIHFRQHGLTAEQYLAKYPGERLVSPRLVQKRAESNIGKRLLPISRRAGAIHCDKCGDWYLPRYAAQHLRECVEKCPDKYVVEQDYVKCPECGQAFTRLGKHLEEEHGWSKDKLEMEVNAGLRVMAKKLVDQWVGSTDVDGIREKREATMLAKYGVKNPFELPEFRKKIVETSQRRYGTDHPMQNEEVRIRQNESAQNGPSEQEVFFDEHTCDSVIYTGYGGRYIRCKVPVRKYGREFFDLNPDFMVLPDNVLESAISASKERRKLSSEKHRTKYVIELLGNWYHSEAVIGVPPAEHEKEVVDAYKSAGIECLALWEHDVLDRWNEIEPRVNEWIQRAVTDINANPVWRKATKNKVDGRRGTLVCPFGSGKVFKSQTKLDKWVASPLNLWRPEMVEGKDYVRCLECPNVRVGKVAEHLRTMHGGMTKEQYLERHPGALLVAARISELVARNNHAKTGIISRTKQGV